MEKIIKHVHLLLDLNKLRILLKISAKFILMAGLYLASICYFFKRLPYQCLSVPAVSPGGPFIINKYC
jgi:hypothetical protein